MLFQIQKQHRVKTCVEALVYPVSSYSVQSSNYMFILAYGVKFLTTFCPIDFGPVKLYSIHRHQAGMFNECQKSLVMCSKRGMPGNGRVFMEC